MIVVRVEMWPYGNSQRATEIGRAYIWNDGTEYNPLYGNYGAAIMDRESVKRLPAGVGHGFESGTCLRRGGVDHFPRGPDNLWPLILAALKSCKLRKRQAEPRSHGADGMKP